MHHSKTSTEAPYTSAGRASVGWQHGPSKTEPLSSSSTNMTLKLDPSTNPQVKHKQTSFDICLQQGNGGWKPCFSDQIIFKSILPKMLCWNQPPGKAGPQETSCAKSSKTATVFKTETLIHKFQCSIGYSRTFFAACVHCVCCWSLDTLETYHSEILWEQCWRWNLTLDHWTLGQVLLSSSTGLKEHLQRHIFLMAKLDSLLHVYTTARTNTQHWLSCPSVERKQWEASSAARFSSCQIECEAIQLCWVRDPGKQAWMAGLSLSSTSCCKKVSWFQLRLQKGLKTFDRDLALFRKRFWVHSHNIHNPRNAPVLVVAVAPCEFAPGFSRPSPALPSPPNRQCLADLGMDEFPIISSCLRKSKIKRSQSPRKVNDITRFIARCQTFR